MKKHLTPEQLKIIGNLNSVKDLSVPKSRIEEKEMPKVNEVITDILNDVLLGLAASASLFVKNPEHQQQAGKALSLLSQVVASIEAQINPPATQTPAPTAN